MTLCSRNYLITSRKVPRSEIMCTEWRGEDCPIISAWRAYVRGDFRRKTQAIKYPTVPSRVQIGTLEVCHPLSPRQARRFRCAPRIRTYCCVAAATRRVRALFGRRLSERGDGFANPVSENLHKADITLDRCV
jgi:hypothetical protein